MTSSWPGVLHPEYNSPWWRWPRGVADPEPRPGPGGAQKPARPRNARKGAGVPVWLGPGIAGADHNRCLLPRNPGQFAPNRGRNLRQPHHQDESMPDRDLDAEEVITNVQSTGLETGLSAYDQRIRRRCSATFDPQSDAPCFKSTEVGSVYHGKRYDLMPSPPGSTCDRGTR